MQINISSKLRRQLETDETIRKHYGKLADKIIICISILIGADCLQEVPNTPPTRRHKLSGLYKDCWAIDLYKNWRMILRPIQICDDLSKIIDVEIVDIVDYH